MDCETDMVEGATECRIAIPSGYFSARYSSINRIIFCYLKMLLKKNHHYLISLKFIQILMIKQTFHELDHVQYIKHQHRRFVRMIPEYVIIFL